VISPIKIGITGTHSTGKSSFLESLQQKLGSNLRVHRIGDFAVRAKELGFPILRDHNYESTLWIISECMRLEAEASLANDVVLIDRPVIDALGYLHAALRLTGRKIGERRSAELATIVKAHTPDYDLLVRTSLDKTIGLGEGRDQNAEFRDAAASSIEALVFEIAPEAQVLTSSNQDEIVQRAVALVSSRRPAAASR
jgi:GTPase SAR1 family protein